MKVALLGDGTKQNVVEAVSRHTDWLAERAEIVTTDLKPNSDLSGLAADLVLVFGGDGFTLGAVRRMGAHQIPILGINFGKLGFLAEVPNEQIRDILQEILSKPLSYTERMTLDILLFDNGKETFRSFAINDVVVRSRQIRMVQTQLCIDGSCISSFRGDGLIISTPTGTTAHSLAAGGPLVEPTIDAIAVTPLASHSLTARPLTISAERELEIRLLPDYDEAVLIVDGQEQVDISKELRVLIRRSDTRFKLVQRGDMGYFDILRTKLNWGSTANYGV